MASGPVQAIAGYRCLRSLGPRATSAVLRSRQGDGSPAADRPQQQQV